MANDTSARIRKVVCIEDNEGLVALITLILKAKGFEVIGALSGPEGLALIPIAKPDVVLLDILMPGMNGWEVYQRMKGDEYMRTIPVIVVTSMVKEIDEALARYIAKVDDYVRKPFTPSELEESINKVLSISEKALQRQSVTV